MKKPNILFITTDQQRKDTLGCYGNNQIQTPNLDKLAQEGVVFERVYCESPICIPSRNTMITGKNARHHGASLHNTSIRDSELTIGEVLQEAGYTTYFAGKPHFKSQQHRDTEESIADWRDGKFNGWNGPYAGFERVDIVLGHSNSLVGHYGEWLQEKYPEAYLFYMDKNLEPLKGISGQGVYNNNIPEETFSSTYIGEKVCEFLETAEDGKQPFYCFASFPDPHWPIMPPREFFQMYDEMQMSENIPYNEEDGKENYPRQFRQLMGKKEQQSGIAYDGGGHYMKNPKDAAKIMRAYWGAITLIDKNIGRILDKLENSGMSEDTIVIFTTDHGEYMGTHGMMAKGGFLWEQFINVPFIMKYPKAEKQGFRTDALFSFTDIVPTLLDYAGIDKHALAPDGISQRAVFEGLQSEIRNVVTVHHPNNQEQNDVSAVYKDEELEQSMINPDQFALITKKWKLIYYAGQKNGLLFDLQNDPDELNNLYNTQPYEQIQHKLEKRLLDELILQSDKQVLVNKRGADCYGQHVMTYEMWKPEFDNIKASTGI